MSRQQALRVFNNHQTNSTTILNSLQITALPPQWSLFQPPFHHKAPLSLYRFSEANTLLIKSIKNQHVFSLSTVIHAYSKLNRFTEAIVLFSRMISHGLSPDSRVIASIVKACSGLKDLRTGKKIHGFCVAFGLCIHSFVRSSLVHLYVKWRELDNAHKLFDELSQLDVVSCSMLFRVMPKKGV